MRPSTVPRSLALAAMVALAAAPAALAFTPDEMLGDPALEARARRISLGLRCVVCQNQSIDDSNAPLAHDLRVLVRERLTKGDSDQQAIDYIVARYGTFVLLRPPLQFDTLLLWFGPLVLLAVAIPLVRRTLKVQDTAPPDATPLSDDERKRLDAILKSNAT